MRHWAALGVKRHRLISTAKWTFITVSDWQVIWIAESCLPGCVKKKLKKRKKYQRGFVPQTSSPLPLSWRQRHWPVSPWCDALIYVTLAPPLSSGRVATVGWSEQKNHINKYTRIHTETESLCATLSFYCSVIQKSRAVRWLLIQTSLNIICLAICFFYISSVFKTDLVYKSCKS